MAASVKDAAAVVDLGPCRWCDDPQWRHRRGKGGCQEVGCGCDKYGPPKSVLAAEPAGLVEADPASPVPGVAGERPDDADPGVQVAGPEPARPGDVALPVEYAEQVAAIDAQLAEPQPKCAYPNGDDEGEHDHALCEDVVAEREEQLERQRLVALVSQLTAENERLRQANVEAGRARAENARLARSVIETAGERDGARAQRDQAYERVDEMDGELGRIRAVLGVDVDADLVDAVDRLSADMAEERREHQATSVMLGRRTDEVEQLRAALTRGQGGRTASELERQERYRCPECGRRYGWQVTDHECGPLELVTVLILRGAL